MLVTEKMSTNFLCCSRNHRLRDVLPMFAHTTSNILPVVDDDNKLIGIITKNKIFKVLTTQPSFDTPISCYYNPDPVFIFPSNSFEETRRLLLKHNLGHAPVVDDEMRPIGVISTEQILNSYNCMLSNVESQLSLLFHNLNFGLLSLDTNLQINSSNPIARKLLGLEDIQVYAIRDNAELFCVKEMIEDIIFRGLTAAKKQLMMNGLSLYIQVYPLCNDGTLAGAMVIIEDVTHFEKTINELHLTKKWEQKLRSAIEMAYDGMILLNKQGEITMVNKGFTDLFGLNSKDILDKSATDLFPNLAIENVMKSGISLRNTPQLIEGQQSLISIFPIKENEETIGAICKVTYRGLTHLHEALTKVKKLEKQLSDYQNEINEMRGTKYNFFDIAGESDVIRKIKQEAVLASRSMSTVLITGESGTGKELFAHGIHASSGQMGPFVQVNCAAVPPELLESEFFGYGDGAFTGAKKGGMKGKFELAQNGTIFLDEIGEMSMPLQAKILRVLQERDFQPIGSMKTIQLNTKIIAATNQNIEQLVKEGKFREDLYYRLNIVRLNIPSLRDRIEDLPDIIQAITTRLNQNGFYIRGVTHSALAKLIRHSWPGNVRELHNVLERAANLKTGDYIEAHDIPTFNQTTMVIRRPPLEDASSFKDSMDLTEKNMIIAALKKANGNKTKASQLLGISRPWLYAKIKKYLIE